MITVCSRCKQTISETFEEGCDTKVSHGICTRCLAVLESEIRESTKAEGDRVEAETTPLCAKDP